MENLHDFDWTIFELNAIESLGYAKDYIIYAKDKAIVLSRGHAQKLNFAIFLVNEVQEDLYAK